MLGGAETRQLIIVHAYASWLFVAALLLLHVVEERRRRGVQTSEPAAVPAFGARYVFGPPQRRWAIAWSLVPLALAVAVSRKAITIPPFVGMIFQLLENPNPDMPVYRPVDPAYSLPFGPGPFRPSRADLATGGLPERDRFVQQGAGCGTLGCHVDITKNWAVSTHRHSDNPFVQKVMGALINERGVQAGRYCAEVAA